MGPKRVAHVHVESFDDEVCVYDTERKKVHALNPTAALVWSQCDGATSKSEIATRLREKTGVEHAEELVDMALDRLAAAQLLESPAGSFRDPEV